MLANWAVVLSALVYLCLLFAVAHWGDHGGKRLFRRGSRATIYALALAVYCTSWTFFGSVGLASRSGLDFLAIYIGPVLLIGLGYPLVRRVVRIAKSQNITSVADFVAARYGKSERVAAIVSVIAALGSLPYIALQLKAVSTSLGVFLTPAGGDLTTQMPVFGDVALLVALVLAGFAVAFGTRHADATEHQDGLVLAVALESLVKLFAFLFVGAVVTWALLMDGKLALSGPMLARALDSLGPTSDLTSFMTLVLLAACVSLLLPRQFHMIVVENQAESDVQRAAWMFPLYLVLINLFVIPIAIAGIGAFPPGTIDRDMTVWRFPSRRDGASSP
jgi:Na+/proline symporter